MCQRCKQTKLSPIEFKWGRKDCPTSPDSNAIENIPRTSMNLASVLAFFQKEFDMDEDNVVALMGVHTLGGARATNSGFKGTFVPDEREWFNNEWYKRVVDPKLNYIQHVRNNFC